MGFKEFRLEEGDTPEKLLEEVSPNGCGRFGNIKDFGRMAFFDEPWHPDRWIVRIEDLDLTEEEMISLNKEVGYEAVDNWDEQGDIDYLGPEGFVLLCQAARVREDLVDRDPKMVRKYIHCMLNTWGYSRWEETKFTAFHSLLSGMMVFFDFFFRDEVKALHASKKVLDFFKMGKGPSGSESPWVKTRRDSPSTR